VRRVAGDVRHLPKPFDPLALVASIADLWEPTPR
jgi:hypothetical protein